MKLLVGLGNPGSEYEHTRHNAGHFFVDQIGQLEGYKLYKSTSFMNRSGQFVLGLLKQTGASPSDLVIVHDDWAFEVGEFKIQKGRSANRHKGVEDIIEKLGTNGFWRVRIGIGSVPDGVEGSEWVLGKMSGVEKDQLIKLVEPIMEKLVKLEVENY